MTIISRMIKKGFKPKWTSFHSKRAEEFEKSHFTKNQGKIYSNHDDYMKWLYGKKN